VAVGLRLLAKEHADAMGWQSYRLIIEKASVDVTDGVSVNVYLANLIHPAGSTE